MLFNGYKVNGTTLSEIQNCLAPISRKIQDIADKEYHRLIGEEAACLGDAIVLNAIERDPNVNYITTAANNVDFWIQKYGMSRMFGKYNFSLYGYLFNYKHKTYMRVEFKNPIFKDAFQDLDDISISKFDYDNQSGWTSEFWHYVVESIQKTEPLSINLSPKLEFKMDKLVFPTVSERIDALSRHQEMNRMLNFLQNGQEIPPFRLMPFLDLAMETYLSKYPDESENSQIYMDRQKLKELLLDFNKKENRNSLKGSFTPSEPEATEGGRTDDMPSDNE